jgi:hypothetical protein
MHINHIVINLRSKLTIVYSELIRYVLRNIPTIGIVIMTLCFNYLYFMLHILRNFYIVFCIQYSGKNDSIINS